MASSEASARWASAVASNRGSSGSPVTDCRGPKSSASLMRRAASPRLIRSRLAKAYDSLPPSSSLVAGRAAG